MDNSNNSPTPRQSAALPTRPQAQPLTPPARDYSGSHNAAADLIRGQIEHIYNGGSAEETPHTTPVATESTNTQPAPAPAEPAAPQQTNPSSAQQTTTHNFRTEPPQQTQITVPETLQKQHSPTHITDEHWKKYHSEWQRYYQMYYERYYANHLHTKEQELSVLRQNSSSPVNDAAEPDEDVADKKAIQELRSQIRNKVKTSAVKVKKSRHFIPALAGIMVLVVFLFLQYNRIIFGAVAAYTTPGNIDPQNIIVNPTTEVEVGEEPQMIIPKINVDAPVVYGAGADYQSQMIAMRSGIAHFSIPGANAVPGQVGNAVFAAHSSNDAFAAGDYKFIFAQNEKLQKGDIIYMNYQKKRYTYAVTSTEVVLPNEVNKVQLDTDKPMLTLISCVPLGTAEKRLLVFAEQISPDPKKAPHTEPTETPADATSPNIPGKPSPTLLERLFGAQ